MRRSVSRGESSCGLREFVESSFRHEQGRGASPARSEPASRFGDNLNFSVEKSIRYHARRQAHYELIHRCLMFSVIFFGSAAFGDLFGRPEWLGLGAALFAAFDLVWSFSTKARDHHFLRMRFSDLASDIRGLDPTEALVAEWLKRRVDIEKDEGPIYWAVEKSCYNEVREAWGWTNTEKNNLSLCEYWFMNWRRFEKVG
jgi:hypothetical protein